MTREALWTIQELADFLGVPVATVYRWRSLGTGPPGLKLSGKHVRYRPADVESWLSTRGVQEAASR